MRNFCGDSELCFVKGGGHAVSVDFLSVSKGVLSNQTQRLMVIILGPALAYTLAAYRMHKIDCNFVRKKVRAGAAGHISKWD